MKVIKDGQRYQEIWAALPWNFAMGVDLFLIIELFLNKWMVQWLLNMLMFGKYLKYDMKRKLLMGTAQCESRRCNLRKWSNSFSKYCLPRVSSHLVFVQN